MSGVRHRHASSANTPHKQECFRQIAGAVFGIASNAIKRGTYEQIIYIDLTAGPGVLPDERGTGHEGSPPIALRLLAGLKVPYRAVFVEQEQTHADELRDRVWGPGRRGDGRCVVIDGDHGDPGVAQAIVGWTCRGPALGLIYVDLDGGGRLPVATIRTLLDAGLGRLDVAFHVAVNAGYKRQRGAGVHDLHLVDDVRAIAKRYPHARRKHTAQEWTMGLLSNTPWLREPRWEKLGFVAGREALELLAEIDRTRAERAAIAMRNQAILDLGGAT